MKEVFFKIIELENHQVLLTKDFDEEDENPIISVTFFIEGCKIVNRLGYDNEEQRDKVFLEFKDELAQILVDNILKMMD